VPAPSSPFAGSDWFDPLQDAARGQVRGFIEALLEEELEAALGRGRNERVASSSGRRHGHRPRQLVTTFGSLMLSVPCARLTILRYPPEQDPVPAALRRDRRCCGHSSSRIRSPSAGSTAGGPSSAHPPTVTPPPEPVHHALGAAPPHFHQLRDTTLDIALHVSGSKSFASRPS
jgi:hypothetical protein